MAETALTARSFPRLPPGTTGLEKAAILMLTLGSDAAASVLKLLSEAEVRQIDNTTSRVEVKRTASPNENSSHWQTIRDTFDRCGQARPG